MNKQNLELMIKVLRGVPEETFDLGSEFDFSVIRPDTRKVEFTPGLIKHFCDSTACALGHLALNPEAQALGFKAVPDMYGLPQLVMYEGFEEEMAGTKFLGISQREAAALFGYRDKAMRALYHKSYDIITVADVIEQLEYLLEHGELNMIWGSD